MQSHFIFNFVIREVEICWKTGKGGRKNGRGENDVTSKIQE